LQSIKNISNPQPDIKKLNLTENNSRNNFVIILTQSCENKLNFITDKSNTVLSHSDGYAMPQLRSAGISYNVRQFYI